MRSRQPLALALLLTVISGFCACDAKTIDRRPHDSLDKGLVIMPGAYSIDDYLPMIKGKRVGIVVNHTSVIGETHLVDTLLSLDVSITMIFAPEHGFKGTAYNGEEVSDGLYLGAIPIRSLYGKSRKPSSEDLEEVDVILFDIQDVGARFYTYISTLHYVMEAAAEERKQVVILDRPNPNAHYVDGPIMEDEYKSFVGMHPVPIVYGMTIGEYGQMINGERWLKDGIRCDLDVIPVQEYTHQTYYALPISPSPNLPNDLSILLYPSLCLLEGTVMNEGRGTNRQFQIYGHPAMSKDVFSYTPVSMTSSKYPKQQDVLCGGVDLTAISPKDLFEYRKIDLSYIIDSYRTVGNQGDIPFFLENGWINKLAGTASLKEQIISGMSAAEIRQTWKSDLTSFQSMRAKYLIYSD